MLIYKVSAFQNFGEMPICIRFVYRKYPQGFIFLAFRQIGQKTIKDRHNAVSCIGFSFVGFALIVAGNI